MLKATKSTNITGQSIITDSNGIEQIAVYMSASVSETGNSPSANKTIQNKELYLANKAICRADMAKFDDAVDELMGGATDEN